MRFLKRHLEKVILLVADLPTTIFGKKKKSTKVRVSALPKPVPAVVPAGITVQKHFLDVQNSLGTFELYQKYDPNKNHTIKGSGSLCVGYEEVLVVKRVSARSPCYPGHYLTSTGQLLPKHLIYWLPQ